MRRVLPLLITLILILPAVILPVQATTYHPSSTLILAVGDEKILAIAVAYANLINATVLYAPQITTDIINTIHVLQLEAKITDLYVVGKYASLVADILADTFPTLRVVAVQEEDYGYLSQKLMLRAEGKATEAIIANSSYIGEVAAVTTIALRNGTYLFLAGDIDAIIAALTYLSPTTIYVTSNIDTSIRDRIYLATGVTPKVIDVSNPRALINDWTVAQIQDVNATVLVSSYDAVIKALGAFYTGWRYPVLMVLDPSTLGTDVEDLLASAKPYKIVLAGNEADLTPALEDTVRSLSWSPTVYRITYKYLTEYSCRLILHIYESSYPVVAVYYTVAKGKDHLNITYYVRNIGFYTAYSVAFIVAKQGATIKNAVPTPQNWNYLYEGEEWILWTFDKIDPATEVTVSITVTGVEEFNPAKVHVTWQTSTGYAITGKAFNVLTKIGEMGAYLESFYSGLASALYEIFSWFYSTETIEVPVVGVEVPRYVIGWTILAVAILAFIIGIYLFRRSRVRVKVSW